MDAVKSTIAENFGGSAHKLAADEHQFDIDKDVPDQSGKVALVTGGSEGIVRVSIRDAPVDSPNLC